MTQANIADYPALGMTCQMTVRPCAPLHVQIAALKVTEPYGFTCGAWTASEQHTAALLPSGPLPDCCVRVVQNGEMLKLPEMCPPVAARIFFECTKLDPAARCSALDIVHWLREG